MWAGLLVLCLAFLPIECLAQSSALHVAAGSGTAVTVDLLLAEGADVNQQDSDGWTPLHFAAENGHIVVTKKLLAAAGVDVDIASFAGVTPLWIASRNGHIVVTEKLLAAGADVEKTVRWSWSDGDYNGDMSDTTALMIASGRGHVVVVTKILEYEADKNKSDGSGYTALMLACMNGNVDVAALIADHQRWELAGCVCDETRSDCDFVFDFCFAECGTCEGMSVSSVADEGCTTSPSDGTAVCRTDASMPSTPAPPTSQSTFSPSTPAPPTSQPTFLLLLMRPPRLLMKKSRPHAETAANVT
jgi:ankyrin repeat protein